MNGNFLEFLGVLFIAAIVAGIICLFIFSFLAVFQTRDNTDYIRAEIDEMRGKKEKEKDDEAVNT